MPLLALCIREQNQLCQLHQDIRAQHVRLRSVYAAYNAPASGAPPGVHIDLDQMLGVGKEISSSSPAIGGHQNLYLPRPVDVTNPMSVYAQDLNLGFDTTHIPNRFRVSVYTDDAQKSPAAFDATGVREIVLYFEYASNDQHV